MYYGKLREISCIERLKLFFSSYAGYTVIIGTICLLHSVLYQTLWINIEAPYKFMVPLGVVFNTICLSIVASTIFYFITTFFPKQHKRKVEEYYIRTWLQQLEVYGKWVLEDIGGSVDCSIDDFKEKSYKIDLKSRPDNKIFQGEFVVMDTWFDYFENFFQHEYLYMNQISKYSESVPSEILVEFEQYKQFDNFRNAVLTYKQFYGSSEIYRTIGGFSHIVWDHAHSLIGLPEIYIKHMYD